MARKLYIHEFQVVGQLTFPVDMLRYDSCFPATSEDAVKIAPHFEREGTEEIHLVSYSEKSWVPTQARWISFGWKVTQHRVGHCIND